MSAKLWFSINYEKITEKILVKYKGQPGDQKEISKMSVKTGLLGFKIYTVGSLHIYICRAASCNFISMLLNIPW